MISVFLWTSLPIEHLWYIKSHFTSVSVTEFIIPFINKVYICLKLTFNMNPSASGWIKKLLKEVSVTEGRYLNLTQTEFYDALKHCGFIYGTNVIVINNLVPKGDLSEEELCKTNMLLCMYYMYYTTSASDKFTENVLSFYEQINPTKTSFFDGLLGAKKSPKALEDLIHKRIHIDDNIFTKNFNYFITNALLFIDILAYQKFLTDGEVSEIYLQKMEAAVETIVIAALESKQVKSQYDDSLIRLFEASRRYHDTEHLAYETVIQSLETDIERQYVFDLGCMASWTDKKIDPIEYVFLKQLGIDLEFDQQTTEDSIAHIDTFYSHNEDQIALFENKNLVMNFYDNSSKMVMKLISRNSKRLLTELRESKELMVLLSQSTVRDLTADEQRRMHDQLLDVFKSIPSLAIFMLPGGAILLPIFIKFIPKLLPSAFDDNRIED